VVLLKGLNRALISIVLLFVWVFNFLIGHDKDRWTIEIGVEECWQQEIIKAKYANPVYGCDSNEVLVIYMTYVCNSTSEKCHLYPGDALMEKQDSLFLLLYDFNIYGITIFDTIRKFVIGLTPTVPIMVSCLEPGVYLLSLFGGGFKRKTIDTLYVPSELVGVSSFLIKNLCGEIKKVKIDH